MSNEINRRGFLAAMGAAATAPTAAAAPLHPAGHPPSDQSGVPRRGAGTGDFAQVFGDETGQTGGGWRCAAGVEDRVRASPTTPLGPEGRYARSLAQETKVTNVLP